MAVFQSNVVCRGGRNTSSQPEDQDDLDKIVDESVMNEMFDSNSMSSIPPLVPSTSSSFMSSTTASQRKRRATNAETDKSAKEIAKEKKYAAVLEALNSLTNLKKEMKDEFSTFGELAAIQMRSLPAVQAKSFLRKMNLYLLQCLEDVDLQQEVNELTIN